MTKVKFFYANGTSWAINWMEIGLRIDSNLQFYLPGQDPVSTVSATIQGINGRTAIWNGAPQNDPFPQLLDPDKFDAVRIAYPASMFPMNYSMGSGISQTIAGINALPAGQPFALGGYSQGANVMSSVYDEIRHGSLTSRASSFLGAVLFGNPRRQVNHRGAVGGTWSGSWDIPNSTTGGHGCFPATGAYPRLQNCESKWVEFTYPNDIFASVGDSTKGTNFVAANMEMITLDPGQIVAWFLSGQFPDIIAAISEAFALGNAVMDYVDGAGVALKMGGNGHTSYAFKPPMGLSGDTQYQTALRYLDGLANAYVTAPILSNPTSAGWSTTLHPPSA